MSKLIILIVIAAAGLILGPGLAGNKGYVLFALGHTTIEMTAVTFSLLLTVALLSIWLIEWLLKRTINATRQARELISGRRRRQSRQFTRSGLLALMSGEWANAEKLMTKGAKGAALPVINYLGAAEAAQAQNLVERRDEYLKLAHRKQGDNPLAVALTQARLQIQQGQKEQALATLSSIQREYPDSPHAVMLLKDLYLQLEDWANLLDLLTPLRQSKRMPSAELDALERQAQQGYFAQLGSHQSGQGLQEHWQSLSRKLRHDPTITASYVSQMLRCGEDDEVQPILIKALRKQVDGALLDLVVKLKAEPEALLLEAKHWLKGQTENPHLLATLGQLSLKAKRLEDAKTYLEKSLRLAPSTTAHVALAEVHAASNNPDQALKHYRQSSLDLT
ncbi:tetratricopeptide repeat protein [Corallincola luteus]|uniref:Tetratricopeptide repeat protein n=1 Tax=Corallincola luteus TaxID=1775177 RepID=A0ABY2AIY4_9GAMM|nr:heme biosynthesis HemY N-terminal domain-containing protein [Corallincola luteus]TCI02636.1 tetratricopeptide repeat protein [Corallincola luteus]